MPVIIPSDHFDWWLKDDDPRSEMHKLALENPLDGPLKIYPVSDLVNSPKPDDPRCIEAEKEKNDFLTGVAAIVSALRDGKIECRAYAKRKFHAKAYIAHPRVAVIGSIALVGSSNFTVPGLTQNIELNIQVKAAGDVRQLQDWFELHWNEAESITLDILTTVERHIREYTPFDVYAKALDELFRRHELTASEWEKSQSKINPVLDQYQRDGYASLYHIAANYNGAFLCDGVGLGKTFIGLMLIERLVMYEK